MAVNEPPEKDREVRQEQVGKVGLPPLLEDSATSTLCSSTKCGGKPVFPTCYCATLFFANGIIVCSKDVAG
jgi:hypothetical protein